MQIRDCIDSGLIQGPHMLCAGRCICMTGGHGWQDGIEADGKDECRKAARTLLKEGVDIIKIMATGGVMTKGVEPGSAQLTQEEMAVIIEEAHKAGREKQLPMPKEHKASKMLYMPVLIQLNTVSS